MIEEISNHLPPNNLELVAARQYATVPDYIKGGLLAVHFEVLHDGTGKAALSSLLSILTSFHGVHQWRQPLDANFQAIAGLNRSHAAGCAGEDDVAGQQRQVCGDETDELVAVEAELAGVRILPQLAVLEELDGQVVRIDLCFHIRSQGREGVE